MLMMQVCCIDALKVQVLFGIITVSGYNTIMYMYN